MLLAHMLEDFIESNGLKARVIPRAVKSDAIKCRLFVSDNEGVLVIALRENHFNLAKVSELLGTGLEPASDSEAEQMTGYKKEFMPPISIYGIKVLLDKKVMEKQLLHCLVDEEKTLEITPQEIKDFNDDLEIVDITE